MSIPVGQTCTHLPQAVQESVLGQELDDEVEVDIADSDAYRVGEEERGGRPTIGFEIPAEEFIDLLDARPMGRPLSGRVLLVIGVEIKHS